MPLARIADPSNPPTRACEEEEGNPKNHVMIFHTTEARSAAITTKRLRASILSNPSPTVFATATPKMKGPTKWAPAAKNNVIRGFKAREAMTVATMFELSWNPLRKSKVKAKIKRVTTIYQDCSI
jgi:hypothetical protein